MNLNRSWPVLQLEPWCMCQVLSASTSGSIVCQAVQAGLTLWRPSVWQRSHFNLKNSRQICSEEKWIWVLRLGVARYFFFWTVIVLTHFSINLKRPSVLYSGVRINLGLFISSSTHIYTNKNPQPKVRSSSVTLHICISTNRSCRFNIMLTSQYSISFKKWIRFSLCYFGWQFAPYSRRNFVF